MTGYLLPAVLLFAGFAGGCRDATYSGIGIRETTFQSSPVIIETFRVGNLDLIRGLERLVAGGADITTGQRGGGIASYAGFDDDPIDVDIVWVEFLTDRAYSAQFSLDPRDLPRGVTSGVELVVVIGPNGLLIVADDSGWPDVRHDVATLCGGRVPSKDTAWRRRDPLSLPGLTEAQAKTYPRVAADARCPDPGR